MEEMSETKGLIFRQYQELVSAVDHLVDFIRRQLPLHPIPIAIGYSTIVVSSDNHCHYVTINCGDDKLTLRFCDDNQWQLLTVFSSVISYTILTIDITKFLEQQKDQFLVGLLD